MLSDGAAVAIFLVPTVVIAAGASALAIATRDPQAVEPIVLGVSLLGTLAFLFARSVGTKHAAEFVPKFEALAQRFGGKVVRNVLGDCMLTLPHPRGRFEVEYCVYSSDGESHAPYTRIALVLPARSLERVRRDLFIKPKAIKKLGPATRAEVESITFAKPRLLGKGSAPSVELWPIGWLSGEEAEQTITKALPHLESLATRPWST